MNGYDYRKRYGKHKYPAPLGIGPCEHGCGTEMDRNSSHAPTGVDLWGECPNNPKDGKRMGGPIDYEIVVERRIRALETRAQKAEERARRAERAAGPKRKLERKLHASENKAAKLRDKLLRIKLAIRNIR